MQQLLRLSDLAFFLIHSAGKKKRREEKINQLLFWGGEIEGRSGEMKM